MSVADGTTKTFITLEVSPGVFVKAAVDEAAVTAIIGSMDLARGAQPEEPVMIAADEPAIEFTPQEETEEAEEAEEDSSPMVDWTQRTLPPQVKKILTDAGIPNEISENELEKLLGYVYNQLANSQAAVEPVRPNGHRRTVPSDEAGYPIPPGGITEADPGEVMDDDGVESI
jgi:hypothetical protein